MPAPDIYQEIWNVDLANGNGIKAIKKGTDPTPADEATGYVIVDEKKEAGLAHPLLPKVVIPDDKIQKSYSLVRKLFNNYTWDQTKREIDFPEETEEVQQFLEVIHKAPVMEVARAYVAERSGHAISLDQWWGILERVWFERFDLGNNKDLSGFEHVLVGEQKGGELKGYHFWYKYHLDEHFRVPQATGGEEPEEQDLIDILKMLTPQADDTPDVVTLKYKVRVFDYESGQFRPLTKPIGGFHVGPSAEAVMAMGTVRCLAEANAPKQAIINGTIYNMKLVRSPNDRNIRTYYPEFAGKAN